MKDFQLDKVLCGLNADCAKPYVGRYGWFANTISGLKYSVELGLRNGEYYGKLTNIYNGEDLYMKYDAPFTQRFMINTDVPEFKRTYFYPDNDENVFDINKVVEGSNDFDDSLYGMSGFFADSKETLEELVNTARQYDDKDIDAYLEGNSSYGNCNYGMLIDCLFSGRKLEFYLECDKGFKTLFFYPFVKK